MGRKGKYQKNIKSITVAINGKTFSIELDSNEKIKNDVDLKSISTNLPNQNQNKNKNKRRSKKKQIQQTDQNEQFQQIDQNQQLQINDEIYGNQFGDNMIDDDYLFINELNAFNGAGDFQLDDDLNEDLYFDLDEFPSYDIFN